MVPITGASRHYHLCVYLLYAWFSIILGENYFVSLEFSFSTCDQVTKECPTIQSALDLASGSDSVFIYKGVYGGPGNQALCAILGNDCSQLSGATLSGLGSPEDVVISYEEGANGTDNALRVKQSSIGLIQNITFRNFPLSPLDHSIFGTNIDVQAGVESAGAVYIDGSSSVNISNVIFSNNSASYGGGVYMFQSVVRFDNCQFVDNQASSRGGALYSLVSDVTIVGSVFESNNVTSFSFQGAGVGGAMYFLGANSLVIYDSQFYSNEAERAGGAIFMDSNSNTGEDAALVGSLEIFRAQFLGNMANGQGNCLSSTTCNTRGGALYISVITVLMQDCLFQQNSVITESTIEAAQGGAMFLTSNSYSKIPSGSGVTLQSCEFIENQATGLGGALYVSGQRLQATDCNFQANSVSTVSEFFTDSPSQGGAVWYSSGSLDVGQSSLQRCTFFENQAFSGWGGALFGTYSTSGDMVISDCSFNRNQAFSSYTNQALGGAVMVASSFSLTLERSDFTNNSALPILSLNPLTYSGSGGALYAQSVGVQVQNCNFSSNVALTGQFDSGATGGAVVLEDSNPASITASRFSNNGAAGYYGYSSFASPGTGGGVFVKFSAADIEGCDFGQNWVSAGSSEKSGGGAIAVYFSYTSVSDSESGVSVRNSTFYGNAAFAQLCSVSDQSGQGGAFAVLGETFPAVKLQNNNFSDNIATTVLSTGISSLGGALAVTLASNITIDNCVFARNAAIHGAGDDIASVAGQYEYENYIRSSNSTFINTNNAAKVQLLLAQLRLETNICLLLNKLFDLANDPDNYDVQSQHQSQRQHQGYEDLQVRGRKVGSGGGNRGGLAWARRLQGAGSAAATAGRVGKDSFHAGARSQHVAATQNSALKVLLMEATERTAAASPVEALADAPPTYAWYGSGISEDLLKNGDTPGTIAAVCAADDPTAAGRGDSSDIAARVKVMERFFPTTNIMEGAGGSFDGDGVLEIEWGWDLISALATTADTCRRLGQLIRQLAALDLWRAEHGATESNAVREQEGLVQEGLVREQEQASRDSTLSQQPSKLFQEHRHYLEKEVDNMARQLRSLALLSLNREQPAWGRMERNEHIELPILRRRTKRALLTRGVSTSSLPPSPAATDGAEVDLGGSLALRSAAVDRGKGVVPAVLSYLNSSTVTFFVDFHPGIIITSGLAAIESPRFIGVYHAFFGDLAQVTTSAFYSSNVRNQDDSQVAPHRSNSVLYGDIRHDELVLTAVSATVALFQDRSGNSNQTDAAQGEAEDDSVLEVGVLNFFNATLYIGNNVSVVHDSFLTGSIISGLSGDELSQYSYEFLEPILRAAVLDPHITFQSVAFTGIALNDILSTTIDLSSIISNIGFNISQETLLTFDACTFVVGNGGTIVLDSSVVNAQSFASVSQLDRDETNIRLLLRNNALLNISTGGVMRIVADTIIDSGSATSRAVYNAGSIQLLGQTQSYLYQEATTTTFTFQRLDELASLGSLTSQLGVVGTFVQPEQGTVLLYLNRTSQSLPVLKLVDDSSFRGTVSLNFYIQNDIYPDLYSNKYGADDPSKWTAIAFTDESAVDSGQGSKYEIQPPAGLSFSSSTSKHTVSSTKFKVREIGCAQINTYYEGVPQVLEDKNNKFPCHICLKNSSCAICADTHQCADIGSCSHSHAKYKTDCCDGGCNGIYGECSSSNSKHTKYECRCTTIFYTGTHCDELTASSYLMISSAAFLFLTAFVVLFFFYRTRQQRKVVLEELADGLLNHQIEGTENSAYIQYMQQALILNDVFVKWEEISLESKVGEGSFGVVWKGSFRGAQVAVKQMRSMFAELTEREIDEFRKEAYVMSRLRHPNIVLVMGISLVDQEPPTLPKTRSARPVSIDLDDSAYGPGAGAAAGAGSGNKKGAKPPKTVCIITEYLDQGSLADILYGPTRLPAEVWTYELILTCALQAARGMLYLHSHQPPICHRDLKSSNLVVDDHWVVKVTDFGMSRIVPEKVQDREKGLSTAGSSAANGSSGSSGRGWSRSGMSSSAGRLLRSLPSIISEHDAERELEDNRESRHSKNSRRSRNSRSSREDGTADVGAVVAVATSAAASVADEPSSNPVAGADDDIPDDAEVKAELERQPQREHEQGHEPEQEEGEGDDDEELGTMSLFKRSSLGTGGGTGASGGGPRLSTFSPEMTSNLGTTAWCAPELLTSSTRSRYTVKVDVYSFGMVLWELWEKKRPYDELSSRFDIVDAIREGRRPPISDDCPPSYRSLVQRCWHNDPARRPMFKYITRYLKDELARVKRQKAQLLQQQQRTSSGHTIGAPLLNPLLQYSLSGETFNSKSTLSTLGPLGAGAGAGAPGDEEAGRDSFAVAEGEGEGVAGFLRRSFAVATGRISRGSSLSRPVTGANRGSVTSTSSGAAGTSEVGLTPLSRGSTTRSSAGGGSVSSAGGGAGVGNAEPTGKHAGMSSGDTTEEERAGDNSAIRVSGGPSYPEKRSPLIAAAALDRSLSYLTDSPAPTLPHQLRAEAATAATRAGRPDAAGPAGIGAGAGAGLAGVGWKAGSTTNLNNKSNSNKWRDSYVLKFSGWRSSNPDVGLPPSMSASPSTSSHSASSAATAAAAAAFVTAAAAPHEEDGVQHVAATHSATHSATTYASHACDVDPISAAAADSTAAAAPSASRADESKQQSECESHSS